MKRFAGWLLFFWGCICCICASEISITDSWKYKAENDERFSSMDWNDSDWVTVDLPHTWNAGGSGLVVRKSRDVLVAYIPSGQ